MPVSVSVAIANQVQGAWASYLTRHGRPAQQPHDYVYASARRVCERRMVPELAGSVGALPPCPSPHDASCTNRHDGGRRLQSFSRVPRFDVNTDVNSRV